MKRSKYHKRLCGREKPHLFKISSDSKSWTVENKYEILVSRSLKVAIATCSNIQAC